MKDVDEEQKESLTAYAGDFTRLAVRFTPPGNGRMSGTAALRALKERIRRDFEGDAGKEQALTDEDIEWHTTNGGHHYATLPSGKLASPFRAVRGRVTAKKLRALNVGKYHVEFIPGNLGGFVASHSPEQYRWQKTNGKKAIRMTWKGSRHLASEGTIREEVRRRQFLVGRLMAGWKPIARKARVKLPAAAENQPGNGTVSIRRNAAHGAVLTATNKGKDPELQAIINRNLPKLNKSIRKTAAKRKRALAAKLKRAA